MCRAELYSDPLGPGGAHQGEFLLWIYSLMTPATIQNPKGGDAERCACACQPTNTNTNANTNANANSDDLDPPKVSVAETPV